jgi:prophage regulatory protein
MSTASGSPNRGGVTKAETAPELAQVYLAGKISQGGDWRHEIFPDLSVDSDIITPSAKPVADNIRQGFQCCGPFFVNLEHGQRESVHDEHREERLSASERYVFARSIWFVDKADVVFCYIDGDDAYGTILELGYAKAKGKLIFLAVRFDSESNFEPARFVRDAWFARAACDRFVAVPDVLSAWDTFVAWYWRRNNKQRAAAAHKAEGNGP